MEPIVIGTAATARERAEAMDFIRETAFRWYRCSPPPPPQLIFTARQTGAVVGSISLDCAGETESFSLEEIHEMVYAESPWPFRRSRLVQYGRWMAKVKGISAAMIYASAVHALSLGKDYGFGETKPLIVPILEKFGLDVRLIPTRKIFIEKISEESRGYYLENPPPVIFMLNLAQVRTALEPEVFRAIAAGRLSVWK